MIDYPISNYSSAAAAANNNSYRPTEQLDEAERLMIRNLDRLHQQGLISYEKRDGRINLNINIYCLVIASVTDRDSCLGVTAVTNDYSSYLGLVCLPTQNLHYGVC